MCTSTAWIPLAVFGCQGTFTDKSLCAGPSVFAEEMRTQMGTQMACVCPSFFNCLNPSSMLRSQMLCYEAYQDASAGRQREPASWLATSSGSSLVGRGVTIRFFRNSPLPQSGSLIPDFKTPSPTQPPEALQAQTLWFNGFLLHSRAPGRGE